jgi:hypothetical protein
MADEREATPYNDGGILAPSFTYVEADTGAVRVIAGEQMAALQRAVARMTERLAACGLMLTATNAESD